MGSIPIHLRAANSLAGPARPAENIPMLRRHRKIPQPPIDRLNRPSEARHAGLAAAALIAGIILTTAGATTPRSANVADQWGGGWQWQRLVPPWSPAEKTVFQAPNESVLVDAATGGGIVNRKPFSESRPASGPGGGNLEKSDGKQPCLT